MDTCKCSVGSQFFITGMRSLFLDTSVEAEGTDEYKARLVVGLRYGPHYSFKVVLHSKELSAAVEGGEPYFAIVQN